jgi:hypothetical protein
MGENEAPAPGEPGPKLEPTSLIAEPKSKLVVEPQDVSSEIIQLRETIGAGTEEVRKNKPVVVKQVIPDVKKQGILDELLNPSTITTDKIFGRGLTVGMGLASVGSVSSFTIIGLAMADFIQGGPGTLALVYGTAGMTGLGIATVVGSAALTIAEQMIVLKNTKQFSTLLTVGRVSSRSIDPENKLAPGENHVGEFHFSGNNHIFGTKIPDNPRDVIRDGMKGLYELAKACKAEDKWLNGINTFIGESRIVDKSYERFGFKVHEVEEPKPNLFGKIDKSFKRIWSQLSRMSRKERHQKKKAFIATITRTELINHEEVFKRFAGIKE